MTRWLGSTRLVATARRRRHRDDPGPRPLHGQGGHPMSTRARPPASSTASCGQEPKKSDSSRDPSSVPRSGARGLRRRRLPHREWTYEKSDATSASTLPSRASAWLATQPCTGRLPRSSIAGTDQGHHHRRPGNGRQPGFGNYDEGVSGVLQLRLGSTGQR